MGVAIVPACTNHGTKAEGQEKAVQEVERQVLARCGMKAFPLADLNTAIAKRLKTLNEQMYTAMASHGASCLSRLMACLVAFTRNRSCLPWENGQR